MPTTGHSLRDGLRVSWPIVPACAASIPIQVGRCSLGSVATWPASLFQTLHLGMPVMSGNTREAG